MELKVGTSLIRAHNPQQKNVTPQNGNLKGITFPKNESLEHLMFNKGKLPNNVYPGIYDFNCQSVSKRLNKEIPVVQLTSTGCGGGG